MTCRIGERGGLGLLQESYAVAAAIAFYGGSKDRSGPEAEGWVQLQVQGLGFREGDHGARIWNGSEKVLEKKPKEGLLELA